MIEAGTCHKNVNTTTNNNTTTCIITTGTTTTTITTTNTIITTTATTARQYHSPPNQEGKAAKNEHAVRLILTRSQQKGPSDGSEQQQPEKDRCKHLALT